MNWSPYPTCRDSGSSWIGSIPSNWQVAQLKRVASRITDGAHVSPETDGGVYDFVSTRDVTENGIDFEGSLKTTPESYEYLVRNGCRPVQGDVLFSKDGTIGRTVVVPSNHPFVVASSLIIIRPNRRKVTPEFLHFLCQAKSVVCQVDSFVRGAGLPRLSIANLTKIFGAFPPVEEQRQIARFLSRETAKIDALIAKQEQLIATLREDRTATIARAVSMGVDPAAQTEASKLGWVDYCPSDWPLVPLKSVISFQEGPGIMAAEFRDEGVPLLRVASVSSEVATLDGCNYLDPEQVRTTWSRFRVNSGDLLISASASMGTVAEVGPDVAGAVPYTGIIRVFAGPKVRREFMKWYLVSVPFTTQIDLMKQGSTIQHYGPTHLSRMRLHVPPLDEQDRIVAYLQARCAQIDALISKARNLIANMQEYRSALITDAVTGKIDVRGAA